MTRLRIGWLPLTVASPMLFVALCVWLHLQDASSVTHCAAAAKGTEEDAYADLEPEAKAAFTWFDSLRFPDVKGRQYVRVATGEIRTHQDGREERIFASGFLLDEGADSFTVLDRDLWVKKYPKTPGDAPGERFEILDLGEQMATTLRYVQKLPADDYAWAVPHFGGGLKDGGTLSLRVGAVVCAWACARNGLHELAQSLYDQANRLPDSVQAKGETLHTIVAQELSYLMMWRAVLAFGDPSISRPELLRRFEFLIEEFPDSEYVLGTQRAGVAASTYAELLRRMIAEDEAHAETVKPLAEMSENERMADLIFQLRDQNGSQWSQPGSCDIFGDPRGEQSPAHQLVKIGYAAVPQLIEVLEDERFTRSVGLHRDFYFSHHVLRVGDCALAIIERIAGRRFYGRSYTDAEMIKDDEATAVKAEIEAWWAEFRQKGCGAPRL